MNINVTKTQVSITNDYILNDKEYNVNKCYFTFSEEYTNQLVKKAIFVQGTATIEEPIINNECLIPSEVLNRGTFELRVYAYEVEDEELILRYSPTPTLVYVRAGSYIEGAESPEVITPSQFEQYMQALNDGLNEVANVNIDAEQLTNGSKITITDRTGEEKIVYVYDGVDGVDGKDATINGVNTLSIVAGQNIGLNQVGDTLTINNTYDDTQIVNDITNLQSGLSGEILNRQNADNNLQSQIDAITVSSDVIDVVGTYQELLDYDTQHVKANDIIKVLQDSTHNEALSYYRWVIVNHIGSWVYVGSEGPFYTKSETDELLNAKQNEITSSNKLSADLVDDSTSTNKFITQSQANQIVTNQNNITNLQTNKQDKLTFDETPIENSTNPVTSGGIYTSQEEQNELIDYLSLYANALPKVTGAGTNITLNDTAECPMPMSLKPSTTSQATSILPDGYTQVDYIEATNTQYIDTGYSLQNSNLEINTKVYISTLPTSGEQDIVSNQDNSTNRFVLGVNQSYIFGYSRSGSWSDTNVTTANLTAPDTFTIKMKYDYTNGTKTLTVNGTTTSQIQAVQIAPSNNTIKLFTNGTGTGNRFVGRIYYLNLIENNVLAKEFIPCYRNSDNVVGMYDTVGNTFYTNAGTGVFTYGAVATLPNPDYPIDIHTVSGNNTITICGKNLFPNTNLSNYTITSTGNYTNGVDRLCTPYIDVTNINTLTLSSTVGTFFDFCGIAFYDNNKNYVSRNIGGGVTTFSVSISNNIKYVRAFFQNQAVQHNDIQTLLTQYGIQLEEGSQATTYTPYTKQTLPLNLGVIELCKIGTYEDYFYKNSDKWYLHKEIGKHIFSNNDEIRVTGSNFYTSITPTPLHYLAYMNTYLYDNRESGFNNMPIYHFGFEGNGTMHFKNTDYTTGSALLQNLINTNSYLIYILKVTTDTEITDTTLISQLEAIYNKAISYQDQTNITQVNNDLPFVITASAIYDLSNLLN